MGLRIKHVVFATAVTLLPLGSLVLAPPAAAQAEVAVSFDAFHDRLAPYGAWFYSDRWGVVWQPGNVSDDFRPYNTDGRWVYTDAYGWFWSSDYEWGDIPFHYGRWVDDPDQGWLWIPGYVWSPGWVIWRRSTDYVGWMPMPPDQAFLSGGDQFSGPATEYDDADGYYGYSHWYGPTYRPDQFAAAWIFIGVGHLADRDYRPYAVPQTRVVTIIHQTRNITNYTVVNNYIVNRSVTAQAVEHARGQPVRAVRVADVTRRPGLITTVAAGRQARSHEMPRGTGLRNSAPKPSEAVQHKLSPAPARHHGPTPAPAPVRQPVATPETAPKAHTERPVATPEAAPKARTERPGATAHRPGEAAPNVEPAQHVEPVQHVEPAQHHAAPPANRGPAESRERKPAPPPAEPATHRPAAPARPEAAPQHEPRDMQPKPTGEPHAESRRGTEHPQGAEHPQNAPAEHHDRTDRKPENAPQ